MKRRSFLRNIATSSAGLSLLRLPSVSAVGANDRVRVGLIGCGTRGKYVGQRMLSLPNVEFVAVCDVDEKKRTRAKGWAGQHCELYGDFRKVLDRADVDAVLVTTPDHWHAIPTILACQAGKDVYVEKPLAHNIREGRAMIESARRHNRVVQTGMQQRSAQHFDTMRDIIREGKIGNVRLVRIWNFKNTSPSRETQPSAGTQSDHETPKSNVSPPQGFDWDFFVGPAPMVPYDFRRHSNFRRYWDYAGGIATNFGTHRFDSVRHAMSIDAEQPKTISAAGQRFEVHDGSEDPDVVQMTFEYDNFVLSYEGCMMNSLGLGFRTPGRPYYNMIGTHDRPNGMAFYGTEGAIFADRLGFELYPELKPGKRADRLEPSQVTPDLFRTAAEDGRSNDSTLLHAQNFIDCVRSRNTPIADVEIGHRSSILPHLGNIACRIGDKLEWDAEREQITNSPKAAELLGRVARKPWDLI